MKQFSVDDPIHFIGIGGTGMAPLAEHCLARGLKVQGSDASPNLATKRLKKLGATIVDTHSSDLVSKAKTTVYSTAIKSENSELVAARANSNLILHRSDLLAKLLEPYQAITIAGTHGKTTTSALVAHMLVELGADPSAVVGGRVLSWDSYAKIGHSNYFVAEADESDGSLIKYSPFIAVLTNIDDDHLDVHGSIEGLIDLFKKYLERCSPEGSLVIGWDNAHARTLAQNVERPRLSYGQAIGSDVRLLSYKIDHGRLLIDAVVEKDRVKLSLPMIGKHNAQNALCALAVARALELDIHLAAKALESFGGVARRLSLVTQTESLLVFDDYAHNPGKIAACITAVKEAYPDHELRVVFQPHRFSRLQTMFKQFASSFGAADLVFITPVFAAGEPDDPMYSSTMIAEAITTHSSVDCVATKNLPDCLKEVRQDLGKSVIILTLGAGDIWQIGAQIKEGLHASQKIENFPSKQT